MHAGNQDISQCISADAPVLCDLSKISSGDWVTSGRSVQNFCFQTELLLQHSLQLCMHNHHTHCHWQRLEGRAEVPEVVGVLLIPWWLAVTTQICLITSAKFLAAKSNIEGQLCQAMSNMQSVQIFCVILLAVRWNCVSYTACKACLKEYTLPSC